MHVSITSVRRYLEDKPERPCLKCGESTKNLTYCAACLIEASVGPGELRPCQPTQAPPGSVEKMEVLRGRVERGEELYHEDDRKELAAGSVMRPSTIGEKRGLRECVTVSVVTSKETYRE